MTSQNVIEVVISQNNWPTRLTYKQWSHITENHDYMAGCIGMVLETIAEPDLIVKGWTDELIAIKHYPKTVISRKDAVVIYKELKNDGFVITSFLTSSCEKLSSEASYGRSQSLKPTFRTLNCHRSKKPLK
jgi:hypothetical protein